MTNGRESIEEERVVNEVEDEEGEIFLVERSHSGDTVILNDEMRAELQADLVNENNYYNHLQVQEGIDLQEENQANNNIINNNTRLLLARLLLEEKRARLEERFQELQEKRREIQEENTRLLVGFQELHEEMRGLRGEPEEAEEESTRIQGILRGLLRGLGIRLEDIVGCITNITFFVTGKVDGVRNILWFICRDFGAIHLIREKENSLILLHKFVFNNYPDKLLFFTVISNLGQFVFYFFILNRYSYYINKNLLDVSLKIPRNNETGFVKYIKETFNVYCRFWDWNNITFLKGAKEIARIFFQTLIFVTFVDYFLSKIFDSSSFFPDSIFKFVEVSALSLFITNKYCVFYFFSTFLAHLELFFNSFPCDLYKLFDYFFSLDSLDILNI